MTTAAEPTVGRALAWGTGGSLLLRVGTLVVGVVLARLLGPSDFGVFAVALTVSTILMSISDLGLGAGLVRSTDPDGDAPTVATVSLGVGTVLCLAVVMSAATIERFFGVDGSASVVTVMALAIPIGSAGVVPFAMLQRRYQQKRLMLAAAADFVVGTTVTIILVLLGMGPLALAISRVAAQSAATTVQFVAAGARPRFGFDMRRAGPAVRFGVPIAGANLLSWAVISSDNVVVGRVSGQVALGLYVLAFNVSSWPMTAIGQAVRSVALPWFARAAIDDADGTRDRSLARAGALTWAAALPAGGLIALLAVPIVDTLYGSEWSGAAGALAALGVFGALRVMFDLLATYLTARGASRPVFWVQVLWISALVPAAVVGAHLNGIVGVAWSHSLVGLLIVLPAYLWAARRIGADIHALTVACAPPVLAFAATVCPVIVVTRTFDEPVLQASMAGLVGALVYAGFIHHWITGVIERSRTTPAGRTGGHRG
ncbi:oligosaccharide flippase family protein [Rhodococcus sp. BP-316]|uniref:oligosaccharide flippase family protein n=1 Tax=Rhodococcus sp. BP-316 TaxID=2739445 RepID=UPI001C9A3D67|nr:oligosaccharide flippase family protein [Rhodococcus sp. BP-316]MBY6680375.1 oligosaccharide flippase family protein [Rhodococcus sp. BP-316]